MITLKLLKIRIMPQTSPMDWMLILINKIFNYHGPLLRTFRLQKVLSRKLMDYNIKFRLDQKMRQSHKIITGHYGNNSIGSTNLTSKIVRNIPEGNYFWRVRAIDHGLGKSNWSSEDYFY